MATWSAAMATSTAVIAAFTVDGLACSVDMETFSVDLTQPTPVRGFTPEGTVTAWAEENTGSEAQSKGFPHACLLGSKGFSFFTLSGSVEEYQRTNCYQPGIQHLK